MTHRTPSGGRGRRRTHAHRARRTFWPAGSPHARKPAHGTAAGWATEASVTIGANPRIPEIEGLRAVAALLVAIYHIFQGRVSGGVDVFFVVSGFLVTGSLVARSAAGPPDLVAYAGRLAGRLVPAAVTVLGAVAVGTVLLLPITRAATVFGEIAASALYVENWALVARAVDYAASEEARSPLQHFWAMSVQGQMYLLWPLLIGVVRRQAGPALFRRRLAIVLGVAVGASLAFSVWLTAVDQPVAYFHTGARAWEFAAGGLLALALPGVRSRMERWGHAGQGARLASGWLGLGLIVSCGLVLPVAQSFPGYAALWPVGGACLVLVAAGSPSPRSVGRVLAAPTLVRLGGASYALYLVHWPVLVFAQSILETEGVLSPVPGLIVLAISLVLAVLLARLVETPARARAREIAAARPSRVPAFGAAALAVAVIIGALAPAAITAVEQSVDPVAAVEPALPSGVPDDGQATDPADDASLDGEGAGVLDGLDANVAGDEAPSSAPSGSPGTSPAPATTPRPLTLAEIRGTGALTPRIWRAAGDITELERSGCHQSTRSTTLVLCERGDPAGQVTAMLVGGSHATMWFPAVNRVAKQRHWRLVTAVKGACRITPGRDFGWGVREQTCETWLDELFAQIRQDPPDIIVTTATVTSPDGEVMPPGYLDAWREFRDLGIVVVAIRDIPRAPTDRVDCIARHRHDLEACDISRAATMAPRNPAAVRDLPGNVVLVDLSDYLCVGDACPAVIGSVVVYRDHHHLTNTYARTLAPSLARAIPVDLAPFDPDRAPPPSPSPTPAASGGARDGLG